MWTAVKQRKIAVVNRASSFVEAAKDMPRVKLFEMTRSDIERRNEDLKLNEVFADVPSIRGIAAFHHFTIEEGHVATYTLTNDALKTWPENDLLANEPPTEEQIQDDPSTEEASIQVGDWWMVDYDDEHFPGEVKQIRGGNYQL